MLPTKVLQAGPRTPLIKFIGKHRPPPSLSHAPVPHPASPTSSLPDSFAQYRQKAQQHGPLNGNTSSSSSSSSAYYSSSSSASASASSANYTHLSYGGASQIAHGVVGGRSGRDMGPVEAPKGMFFDRRELPKRFGGLRWTPEEIEAVDSGGASRVW